MLFQGGFLRSLPIRAHYYVVDMGCSYVANGPQAVVNYPLEMGTPFLMPIQTQ